MTGRIVHISIIICLKLCFTKGKIFTDRLFSTQMSANTKVKTKSNHNRRKEGGLKNSQIGSKLNTSHSFYVAEDQSLVPPSLLGSFVVTPIDELGYLYVFDSTKKLIRWVTCKHVQTPGNKCLGHETSLQFA